MGLVERISNQYHCGGFNNPEYILTMGKVNTLFVNLKVILLTSSGIGFFGDH